MEYILRKALQTNSNQIKLIFNQKDTHLEINPRIKDLIINQNYSIPRIIINPLYLNLTLFIPLTFQILTS